MDRRILEQTELASAYDAWQTALLVSGVLAGILTMVTAFCVFQVSHAIPKKANKLAEVGDAALLQRSPSEWPKRLLLSNGWSKLHPSESVGKVEIFVKSENGKAVGTDTTEVIFKSGEQTIAWATAIALGERFIWPYAEDDSGLEDGTNNVSVEASVRGTGIADTVRNSGLNPVDVIGVGLESSHGGDPEDLLRLLSDSRGHRLAEAAYFAVTAVDPEKMVSFRSLGLGRALTFAEKGTDEERRQRSAVVIVATRMSTDTVRLSIEDVLLNLIFDIPIKTVDLSDYEYSEQASARLSPPLAFDN